MTYRQKEGTIPQMNCSASSKIFTSKKNLNRYTPLQQIY